MRHRLNFCFYFFGFYFFYLFIKSFFGGKWMPILLSMFYFLNPRLLAHGFFNGKDSIAQAFVCCTIFPIFMFNKTKDIKWVLLAGLFTGIGITTRIPLVFIPFLFILMIATEQCLKNKKIKISQNFLKIITYYLISVVASVLIFMPTIWHAPLEALKFNFMTFMNYQIWDGFVLFKGEMIRGKDVPWNYTITWFLITTPIMYVVYLAIGLINAIQIILKNSSRHTIFHGFMLGSIFIGIIAPILFKSTLYDSWRHSFYVFPFLAFHMALGFFYVVKKISKLRITNNKVLVYSIVLVATFIEPVIKIITLHPHQQIYFDLFAGKDPMEKYEGDYWCASVKEGLEWIIKNDKRETINIVNSENCPAKKNVYMIDKIDRHRLKFTTRKLDDQISDYVGDYYFTNFRGELNDYIDLKSLKSYPYNNEAFSIKKNNMTILGIYKL